MPDLMTAPPSAKRTPLVDLAGFLIPEPPANLEATGIDPRVFVELALRIADSSSQCTTEWVAGQMRLRIGMVDAIMQQLKTDQLVSVLGQAGPFSHRYVVTEKGHELARRLNDVSGYIGPAPVSLSAYNDMIEWQLSRFPVTSLGAVEKSLTELVLPLEDIQTVAMALTSQRSLFLSGPPGNGKTSIARHLHNAVVGDLWIPYCIAIDREIIRIFDPQWHEPLPIPQQQAKQFDQRWIRVRRPFGIVGGEMTLDTLDLAFRSEGRFYEAPLHLKCNGGTFVIDDFGRQRANPTDLLNRWIVPLERGIDYLTLRGGNKIEVPFHMMLVLSTNLDPDEVMDPAFLRRMGYRLHAGTPTPQRFRKIFENYAAYRRLAVPPGLVERLLERYHAEHRELRCSEPRELIERACDLCRLRQQPPQLTEETIGVAWAVFFGNRRQAA